MEMGIAPLCVCARRLRCVSERACVCDGSLRAIALKRPDSGGGGDAERRELRYAHESLRFVCLALAKFRILCAFPRTLPSVCWRRRRLSRCRQQQARAARAS